jgi:hypothetical protein
VPPCVWVINQQVEDITVVVSKYRPNRLLTDGGVSASSTGGGLNFGTTVTPIKSLYLARITDI